MVDTLTPVLSAIWDTRKSWTLKTYEQHDGYQALRQALRTPRGEIVDANGKVLADSVMRYDIALSPKKAGDIEREVPDPADPSKTTDVTVPLAQVVGDADSQVQRVQDLRQLGQLGGGGGDELGRLADRSRGLVQPQQRARAPGPAFRRRSSRRSAHRSARMLLGCQAARLT